MDRHLVVMHQFRPSIKARYLRIYPKTWYSYISMRIELYGCRLGKAIFCFLSFFVFFKVVWGSSIIDDSDCGNDREEVKNLENWLIKWVDKDPISHCSYDCKVDVLSVGFVILTTGWEMSCYGSNFTIVDLLDNKSFYSQVNFATDQWECRMGESEIAWSQPRLFTTPTMPHSSLGFMDVAAVDTWEPGRRSTTMLTSTCRLTLEAHRRLWGSQCKEDRTLISGWKVSIVPTVWTEFTSWSTWSGIVER